jgi:2-isopropylmalate synthase
VASTELGLLAGAERVEGTLFGNGERTGNLDIITVALNLHMHGIDCGLDFADLSFVEEVYERCTGMSVGPRHPYAGELVFTAFSGSHQDAIKKALTEWKKREGQAHWDVPYLAIDPHDIGRTYSEVIRVNSQSGKGGVAYLLESKFGIDLPKEMQREFGPIANDAVDRLGREVSAEELKSLFWREYIERQEPYVLRHFHSDDTDGIAHCQAHLTHNNQQLDVAGIGNGPIAAFVCALESAGVQAFEVCDYREQAMGRGAEASAIAYICIRTPDGKTRWGAGVDTSIELASIKAVLSALNRL